jgi:hypothetical protein
MKYLNKELTLPYFKTSRDELYNILCEGNIAPFTAVLNNTGGYFYFVNLLEKRIKLRRNRLRSKLMNSPLQESTQFLKIFKKNGLYYKYFLIISKMMSMHRQCFERVDLELNSTYPNYFAFYLFARSNLQFYNFNFLLNFVTIAVDPCIQIKVVTFPKFLQKKFKKRFDFQIKHVDMSLRARYVYKRIILNSEFLSGNDVTTRVYSCLANIFLNPSDNLVMKEKFYFYRYALRMYKLGLVNMQAL